MTLLPLMSRHEAEDFLYEEARLIDEGRLEDWLKLFTEDGLYWVPSDDTVNPDIETSIIYDDSRQREKRVFQLRNKHMAQDPLSRTIHVITNVQVRETDHPDEVMVLCNALITEMRPGDHQQLQKGLARPRQLSGRCIYRLRQKEDEDNWRIAMKQLLLIDRDLPLHNISFIL